MKTQVFLSSALALALAAGAAAQTTSSGTSQGSAAGTSATAGSTQSTAHGPTSRHDRTRSTMQGSHAKSTREAVTVEGCVVREDHAMQSGSTTGKTEGRSVKPWMKDEFALTNATIQPGSASSTSNAPVGTSATGTSGTTAAQPAPRASSESSATNRGRSTEERETSGTTGTSTPDSSAMPGSTGSPMANRTVILTGGREDELGLDRLIGQRVSVTGRVVEPRKERPAKHANAPATSAEAAGTSTQPIKVDIDSVRLVGGGCGAGNR